MLTPTWGDVLIMSFQDIWSGVASFIPLLIVAIIVFVVGLIVASALGKIVEQIVKTLKIDKALENLGLDDIASKAGLKLDSGAFLGGLVKWFFVVVFLVAAIDVLGLEQVNEFLSDVVLVYLPNVIVAVLLLLAGALISGVMQKIVVSSAKAADLNSAGMLGGITKWSIWAFAILAALYQLGIAGELIQTLFTGFVGMLAIAGGLAFGLGGKDAAQKAIDKLKQDISAR